MPDGRFPAETEATAYFLVAEALTNAANHADARQAKVAPPVEDAAPDRRPQRTAAEAPARTEAGCWASAIAS